jgi:hypothetical protein
MTYSYYPGLKRYLSSILFLLFTTTGFTQPEKTFPDGVYLSLEQLRNRTPQFNTYFHVIHRTHVDIAFNGGNDYELKSVNDSLGSVFIKYKMYAYSHNDSVFINCYHYKLYKWYALCLTHGNFLAFKGAIEEGQASQAAGYGVMFGAVGGGVAGAMEAKKRYIYVLSMRTGNIRLLTKEYLAQRLQENNPALLEKFSNEKDPQSEEVLLTYLNLLNESLSQK